MALQQLDSRLIESARLEAQKQWTLNPCGAVSADDADAAFFDRVEAERYRQQAWQHDYFDFSSFKGKKVLEIGTGLGTDLKQFARFGAQCFGVDITDRHLELTRANFAASNLPVQLHKTDATTLPFAAASLDCVYSFGVLHHVPEIDRALAEAHRVLVPGGSLMVAVYYQWSAFFLFWKLLCHGLYRRELFSKGYAGLLATVEHGADGVNIKPYVRLYTKRALRRALHDFEIEDISVHQLEASSFWPSLLQRALDRHVPSLESTLGWYVAAKCRKR